ncbi:MAG TPA: hypothetical protein EYH08_02685 [Pyrodictium sp.]|nr:hypothetical protein [Pyrodictium sp.]
MECVSHAGFEELLDYSFLHFQGTCPIRPKYPVRNCRYFRSNSAITDNGVEIPAMAANILAFSMFELFRYVYTI